jgi:hypothetical protein
MAYQNPYPVVGNNYPSPYIYPDGSGITLSSFVPIRWGMNYGVLPTPVLALAIAETVGRPAPALAAPVTMTAAERRAAAIARTR